MINLSGNGSIWGVASNNNQIVCTLSGLLYGGNNSTYEVLSQGYLVTPSPHLYTVPANNTAFIKRIFLANTSASYQGGISLYASGTGNANTAANQITGTFTIPPNGFVFYDEFGFSVYDANGNLQTSGSTGLSLASRTVLIPGNTTYTTPAGVTSILVQCQGPGGGGSGANGATNNAAYGGGGGAGGYVEKFINYPLPSYAVVVGNGGAGGVASGAAGTSGSANTTFIIPNQTITLTAGLGAGGAVAHNGAVGVSVAGGAGGVATGGDLNVPGGAGGIGFKVAGANNSTGISGFGAASFFGCGGAAAGTATGAGGAATGNGAGGGGGAANGSAAGNGLGGNGSNGVIIIWEFKG